MLITIFVAMLIGYAVFHSVGFISPNPLSLIPGILRGAFKATIHFLFGLSVWTVLFFLIKALTWGLLILSIDILTPPYGIDIESVFAIPLGTYLKTALDISLGWAFGIAYAIVFLLAIGYLALWYYVLRKAPI